jgi:hypothetical protein
MAERLPESAPDALAAGCESDSLAQFAAMDGAGWSEVEPVVARVLAERGDGIFTAHFFSPSPRNASGCTRTPFVTILDAAIIQTYTPNSFTWNRLPKLT